MPDALVQLRQPQLSMNEYSTLVDRLLSDGLIEARRLVLNGKSDLLARHPEVAGLHLPTREAARLGSRAAPATKWLSTAVHDRGELDHASRLGVDYVLVSPVQPTLSHPDRQALGWQGFRELAGMAGRPCYALGGMTPVDSHKAFEQGGQGVAGIRGFWKSEVSLGA